MISVFLTLSGFSMLLISFPIEKRGSINLSLIENFEKAVEGDPSPIRIWNMLFKNAIRDTERFVRNLTGVSQVDFYEPFNTISLALAMGDKKESSSARKWISKLIKVLEKKNINEVQRAKKIFEHVASGESSFPYYKNIHNKFKLQYSVEPLRLRKLSGKVTRVIEIVIGIANIAIAIILYYLTYVH